MGNPFFLSYLSFGTEDPEDTEEPKNPLKKKDISFNIRSFTLNNNSIEINANV